MQRIKEEDKTGGDWVHLRGVLSAMWGRETTSLSTWLGALHRSPHWVSINTLKPIILESIKKMKLKKVLQTGPQSHSNRARVRCVWLQCWAPVATQIREPLGFQHVRARDRAQWQRAWVKGLWSWVWHQHHKKRKSFLSIWNLEVLSILCFCFMLFCLKEAKPGKGTAHRSQLCSGVRTPSLKSLHAWYDTSNKLSNFPKLTFLFVIGDN